MRIRLDNISIRTILFFLVATFSYAQQSNLKFEQVNLPEKIYSNKVNCFLETKDGFLWMGSNDGLFRYDGYRTIKIFSKTREKEPFDFSDVSTILEVEKGILWVGMKKGLYVYNTIKETVEKFKYVDLGAFECKVLYKTSHKEIVIGTNKGLFVFDIESENILSYLHRDGFSESLSNNLIRCVFEDNEGVLWVGTFDKLNRFNREKSTFTRFNLKAITSSNLLQNNLILSIAEVDYNGNNYLLIGTETGLVVFDKKTEDFVVYSQGVEKNQLSNSVIKSMKVVSPEQVWLGTDNGLNVFNMKERSFKKYYANPSYINALVNNVVSAIYKDSKNNLWIGTERGVNITLLNGSGFLHNQINKNSVFFNEVLEVFAIDQDTIGDYWFATNQGFCRYSLKNKAYKSYILSKDLTTKISDMLVAKNGDVWFATSQGLHVFNPKTKDVTSYYSDKNKEGALQTNNYLRSLYEDCLGNIWIGTNKGGLYKVVTSKNNEIKFTKIKSSVSTNISNLSIFKITGDSNNNIWIASDKGVKQINAATGDVKDFLTKNEYVTAMCLESNSVLWLVSKNTLYKYDLISLKLSAVKRDIPKGVKSIIVSNEELWFCTFSDLFKMSKTGTNLEKFTIKETRLKNYNSASFSDEDGRLFFGGTNGFVTFEPEDVKIDTTFFDVQFTNLKVLNKIVSPEMEKSSILSKSINNISKLELEYSDNTFALEFSTLNFLAQENQKYRYILEGYDPSWQEISEGNHVVYYTRVRPGNYIFKIKAANNKGEFPEEYRSMEVTIHPPIWASSIAIFFYVTIFLVLFWMSRKLLVSRIQDKNVIRFEKVQRKKSEELVDVKTRFFTNISHELKTPLTLILSPTERLIAQEKDLEKLSTLKIILRNTKRLLRLTNQILDVRKMEAQKESLRIEKYDLVLLTKKIVALFEDEASRREMRVDFSFQDEQLELFFDVEKVEKIIFNLISNAFKFTADNGCITVSVIKVNLKESDFACVKVGDSGVGISEENQKIIFDRFTHINTSNFTNQVGTGVGLSLAYDYSVLHKGFIDLESEEGVGSTFILHLPLDLVANEDLIEHKKNETNNRILVSEENEEFDVENEEVLGRMKLLIVDDDSEMRQFIGDVFKDDFELLLAADGKEAYDLVFEKIPDVIISDVMMPVMDGISLCKKLKSDIRTSHIPVILLTAKGGMENKMEGIAIGADDYIEKPFHLDFLLLRTKMLIKQREKNKKFYSEKEQISTTEITYNLVDETFLNELLTVIDSQLDNTDLSVHKVAELMHMDRTSLYRKIKAITGQTATSFVRQVRIKKAGQLLKEDRFNVSEVMYMVGFSHRSYFARSFKEQFGISPTDYKARYK